MGLTEWSAEAHVHAARYVAFTVVHCTSNVHIPEGSCGGGTVMSSMHSRPLAAPATAKLKIRLMRRAAHCGGLKNSRNKLLAMQ